MNEKSGGYIDMAIEANTRIYDAPIKLLQGVPTLDHAALETQAGYLRDSMIPVDYEKVRGTCGDERFRIGLASGELKVEARPSVFGGPNIHALFVSEGAGVYHDSDSPATERLKEVTKKINDKKIQSGGHEHCAAAAGFGDAVIPNLLANPESVRTYAKANMGDAYDEAVMTEVLGNFTASAPHYVGWDGEKALVEVLGDQAGDAMEKLVDAPHEGRTLARNKVDGYTIDQTLVHNNAQGEDSFEYDDPYADRIEKAAADGPNSETVMKLMRHAREAVLVGVALSLPNAELHQIDITKA